MFPLYNTNRKWMVCSFCDVIFLSTTNAPCKSCSGVICSNCQSCNSCKIKCESCGYGIPSDRIFECEICSKNICTKRKCSVTQTTKRKRVICKTHREYLNTTDNSNTTSKRTYVVYRFPENICKVSGCNELFIRMKNSRKIKSCPKHRRLCRACMNVSSLLDMHNIVPSCCNKCFSKFSIWRAAICETSNTIVPSEIFVEVWKLFHFDISSELKLNASVYSYLQKNRPINCDKDTGSEFS